MTTERSPDGHQFDAANTDRPSGQELKPEPVEINQSYATAATVTPPMSAVPLDPPVAPARRRQRFWLGFFLRVAIIGIGLVAISIAGLVLAYRWIDPPSTTLIFGQRLLGTEIRQEWRNIDRISPNLISAVVTSEDAGFCRHRGVDWSELEAAYERGQDGGNGGGGSTISMQLIKNLFLWPSRSYVRKALEIPLTLAAETVWTKTRILEMYLNIAELGPGIFGAEAASRFYFRKSAADLTARESALLAAALPNPLQRDASRPTQLHRTLASRLESRMKSGGRFTQCIQK